jgi:hypothetical protein
MYFNIRGFGVGWACVLDAQKTEEEGKTKQTQTDLPRHPSGVTPTAEPVQFNFD